MANTRITPADYTDSAALSLYTGQTARTREDHTRRRFLVCRTGTGTISQHSTSAAAVAELERLQQADSAGEYTVWEYLDLKGGQP